MEQRPSKDNDKISSVQWNVWQGDAFDLFDRLTPGSVDLILTSPPYWGLRSYGMTHNWDIWADWCISHDTDEIPSYEWYRENGGCLGLEPTPDWYVSNIASIMAKAWTVLNPRGNLWLNVGDTYFARWSSIRAKGRQGLSGDERERRRVPMGDYRQEKQLLLVPARVAIKLQSQKWILRNDLIWYKPNVPPRPEKDRLPLTHEHFFHFVKKPTAGRASYYYDLSQVEAPKHDVVKVLVSAGSHDHSATFPQGLIRQRIMSSCPPGGLVVDPFCGTGTTLMVAVENGRKAIGFDVTDQFTRAARENLLGASSRLF